MRWISASTSLLDGTPSLFSALATRSSKIDSSLSHFWPAFAVTSSAIAVILPVTSLMRSSATACVLRCRLMPSFTSVSNTLPPSAWAFEKAPMPASQICCAESLTAEASWLSSSPAGDADFFCAIFWSFLTISCSSGVGRALPRQADRWTLRTPV